MENIELQIISEMYEKNNKLVIFDAGGYDFCDAVCFKKNFPLSEVYSFEADDLNIEKYSKDIINFGINVIPLALSDSNGSVNFFSSLTFTNNLGKTKDHTSSGSILKPIVKNGTNECVNHPGLVFSEKTKSVPCIRIDDFCKQNNIKKIDFFHLDVQGAENIVLAGLGDKLRPQYIFCETCEYTTYDTKGMEKQKFNFFMKELGYDIVKELRHDTIYKYNG